MKKKKETKLKIVAATSTVIFSLFACFTGAYAWFINIANTKSTATQFNAADSSSISFLKDNTKIIYWNKNDGQGHVDTIGDTISLTLNQYDGLVASNNEKNAIYLCFEFSFTKTALSGYFFDVDFTCIGDFLDNSTGIPYVNNWSSNVSQFRLKENDVDIVPSSINTGSTIYNNLKTSFVGIDAIQFVNNPIMDESCKDKIINGEVDLEESHTPGETFQLVIEYDYSPQLTSYFNDHYKTKSSGIDFVKGETVTLNSDIISMEFDLCAQR